MSGSGTGEILDFITEQIPDEVENAVDIYANLPKITIVGQPNAGKSTLLNALVGEERNIVTDIAGTTRDSIHTHYNLYGKEFLLVDTAGIRKKKQGAWGSGILFRYPCGEGDWGIGCLYPDDRRYRGHRAARSENLQHHRTKKERRGDIGEQIGMR